MDETKDILVLVRRALAAVDGATNELTATREALLDAKRKLSNLQPLVVGDNRDPAEVRVY